MKQSNSLAGRFFALKAITISLLLAFFSSSSLAQQPKSGNWDGLKKMMTAEEFERTGLNNLSADELKLLDRWFLKFLAHESEQLVKADSISDQADNRVEVVIPASATREEDN